MGPLGAEGETPRQYICALHKGNASGAVRGIRIIDMHDFSMYSHLWLYWNHVGFFGPIP